MRVAGLVFLSDTENVLMRVDVGHFEKNIFLPFSSWCV